MMIIFKKPPLLILTCYQTGNNWSGLISYGFHFDLEHLAFPYSWVICSLLPLASGMEDICSLTQRPDNRQ